MDPHSLGYLLNMSNQERDEEKQFPNGDKYSGDVSRGIPNGYGKYIWSDGTEYEGNWKFGKMSGKGKMIWSSGSIYKGEFSGGYFDGEGELICPNGYKYIGTWRMNTMHGFGKKNYPNSDTYEGSWKEGNREGSGKYTWSCGNSYFGRWKGGRMFGRGLMKWSNGDLFYGFWINGLRDGLGVYIFCDGGIYYGNWSGGLKDGRGMLYPFGSKNLVVSLCDGYLGKEKGQMGVDLERELELSFDGNGNENGNGNGNRVVFEREYMQGVLIREERKDKSSENSKGGKFGVSKVKRNMCKKIFSRRQSHYLKLNLQYGIRYTVGKITPVPAREVRSADFGKDARIKMFFPRSGSQLTPPHYSLDFHWKDYCPMVFRNLRELFKLNAADYMMSICGDDGLRELSSSGKSGCLFYLSHDDKFVIKTLRKAEVKVLLKMLPGYYEHVRLYENTLITKFFGLHRIKLKRGRKVRFIVMGNMFYTELKIHKRYDLKGSTYGRFTNKDKIKETTTLKDLDLAYQFYMDRLLREALFKQLSLDCKFLESQKIIDYSLLLGLHFRAPDHLKSLCDTFQGETNNSDGTTSSREEPSSRLVLVDHEPNSVNTTPGPHIRGKTLRAFSVGEREVDLVLPGTARLRIQLGVNMPARAMRKLPHDDADPTQVQLVEVYDVVLYLGIIDILQNYSTRKKLEHAWKSTYCDPMSISVLEPQFYSKRFISFLQRVFPPRTL